MRLRSTFSLQYGQVCFFPTMHQPRIQNSWNLSEPTLSHDIDNTCTHHITEILLTHYSTAAAAAAAATTTTTTTTTDAAIPVH